MKRRWWLLAVLAVFSLFAAACGDDNGTETKTDGTDGATESAPPPTFAAGTTMAALQTKGKILVGTKFDQPLFGLRDASGDVNGFDVEIAKLVGEAIFGSDFDDSKIEFKETPSNIREDSIINATVDMVVATYTINAARKEKVGFAGPYFVAGQDIMVKADDDSIKGVEDLNGKKVCSVQGSTSLKNLQEKAPQADASITFDKYSLCAEALDNGQVEAVTTDNVILVGLVQQYGGAFKLVGNTFTEEPYGIGVKKEDVEFRNFVNDVLEESFSNGDWAAAFERTVGVVEKNTPEPPKVDRYS